MQVRLMALHWRVLVVATLVALASAQSSPGCLTTGAFLLDAGCDSYITNAAVTSPSALCCEYVNSVTTTYGPDCLCQVILYVKANPSLQVGVIHGRGYSLAADCNAPANMSACTACCSVDSPIAGTPPSGTSTPAAPGGVSTPTFQVPAAPVSRSEASTGALVGGSVGGVSVVGVILIILYKCLDCSKMDIKWDVNSPCWCCQRREKPSTSTNGETVKAGVKVPYGAHA